MAGRLAANLSRTVISKTSDGRARNVNSYRKGEENEKEQNIVVSPCKIFSFSSPHTEMWEGAGNGLELAKQLTA